MSLSYRRLGAVTVILFVVILAFLVGRVRAGADPAQSATPAAASSAQVEPPSSGIAGPGGDPGSSGDGSALPGSGADPVPGHGADPVPGYRADPVPGYGADPVPGDGSQGDRSGGASEAVPAIPHTDPPAT